MGIDEQRPNRPRCPAAGALRACRRQIRDEQLTLIIVETTDIVFALDSVPAVLAITREPFLVYTSNIFAMLGLRALYFLLAGIVDRFRFINVGLAVILLFFGARLLLSEIIEFPHWLSLGVIAAALALSVAASLKWPGASQSVASSDDTAA